MEPRPAPLRERNRRRVAQEIRDVALERFLAQGYAATSVEQIAAAAGVSMSTFFRHFPTKEDVVFARHDVAVAALRAELAGQPPGPPLSQVRAAVLAVQFGQVDDHGARAVAQLIEHTPSLQARNQQLSVDLEVAVAEHLADPGGLDPVRAHLIAGALFGALRAARRTAAVRTDVTPTALVTSAFDLIEGAAREG